MKRLAVVLALALAGCSAPERERVAGVGQAFYCRLYPSKCVVERASPQGGVEAGKPGPSGAADDKFPPTIRHPPEIPAIEQPAPPVGFAPEPAPDPKPLVKTPVAPSVKAAPERKAEPARPRAKFKPVERKKPTKTPTKLPTKSESGPDLPYPCWLVRFHAAGKSDADLRAMGKANGITLTPKQERQARNCLQKGSRK